MASSWFVNVDDTAKLHIAALLDESVNGQRLWAATGPFSAIDIQEALKEVKPDYTEKDISSFLQEPMSPSTTAKASSCSRSTMGMVSLISRPLSKLTFRTEMPGR